MYTNNPTTSPFSFATGPHSTPLRSPWWTIPGEKKTSYAYFYQYF